MPENLQKRCGSCGVSQVLDAFAFRNKAKGLRQSMCRACHRQYHGDYYRQNKRDYVERRRLRRDAIRRLLEELKRVPCHDCKKRYPPYVMEFDHRDPRRKKFSLARFHERTLSFEVVRAEVRKCDVVCSNCHRERTHGKRSGVV